MFCSGFTNNGDPLVSYPSLLEGKEFKIVPTVFFFEVEICRYFHIVSAITLLLCSKCCGNYLRAETIQGWKLLYNVRDLVENVQTSDFSIVF